jgi:hypothetical protein
MPRRSRGSVTLPALTPDAQERVPTMTFDQWMKVNALQPMAPM